MYVDPIIVQFPEVLDEDRFIIATYYCQTKANTNMMKFAAALAVEQTTGTWLRVPAETPEVREKCIGRVVGIYETPSYQIEIPKDTSLRDFIIRIAYPWANFGPQFAMMMSTVIG
ncbi:MAG TPA: ribulose 1,5-bisphosphate carboxylase, partial [Clostridiaceae bacterium]|nr:ribulose 1,5-bisphosphate carboxylase [Clostridiaceae bacterium]